MKAPSEKHLEDWIVANYQAVGFQTDDGYEGIWDGFVNYIEQIVGRQVRFPSGICDLVVLTAGMRELNVSIVEIKSGPIDSKTIAQCLRYMRDLKGIFYELYADWVRAGKYYTPLGIFDDLNGYNQEVGGIVIGSSIADPNLIITCEACSIVPVIYDYDEESNLYTFDAQGEDNRFVLDDVLARFEIYREFGAGAIGDALKTVMEHRYQDEQRRRRAS